MEQKKNMMTSSVFYKPNWSIGLINFNICCYVISFFCVVIHEHDHLLETKIVQLLLFKLDCRILRFPLLLEMLSLFWDKAK